MNANTITTGEVRFSFPRLFKAECAPGSTTPSFSVTALIPKSDTTTYNAYQAAWQDAVRYGIQNRWNGVQPPMLKGGLKDGDGVKADGTPYGPECKGCWVLTCKTGETYPPQVVDENVRQINDPRKIYSGCYGRVNVSLVPYNNQSKGIQTILNCVQFLRDGDPLCGSAITAAEAFGAPAAPQNPAYQQPAAPQNPAYQQPAAPQYAQPAAPQYAQPAAPQAPAYQQPAIDPITGRPISIMGI